MFVTYFTFISISRMLILDEMDQLESKKQTLLYTIFEWPLIYKANLVLVGIANALDLTDRILPRLEAKLDILPILINFPPYSREEICEILTARLKEVICVYIFFIFFFRFKEKIYITIQIMCQWERLLIF